MLGSLPESEVLPDANEFSVINRFLDHWLHLTGTVDTDIARYPVWRHVTELIEDLEPSNPSLWSNRVLHQLENTEYAQLRHCGIYIHTDCEDLGYRNPIFHNSQNSSTAPLTQLFGTTPSTPRMAAG